MFRLPGEQGWFQNNRGKILGTIKDTFNIDLSSNVGAVRLTRTKRIAYTGSPTGFGEIGAIEKFDGDLYVAAENASADDIWVGGNSPFDGFTNDTTSVEINPLNTDLKAWNSGLYIATGAEIKYTTDGAAWSEIGSDVLSAGGSHLLTAKNDVLYVSDERYKVKSVTSANAFQGTGVQTLNLALPGYSIQMLETGIDKIWVGLSNTDGSTPSLVFEWDGETENAPDARYEINASAILAGIVKDGIPYLVDSLGRLMVLNGGAFVEVARFPLNGRTLKGFAVTGHRSRAIHPRGMAIDADEILINIANRTDEITADDYNEFPSGVWAYSETNGLYHKYSPSYQAVADTGTTNLTDHGQFRTMSGGPMIVVESESVGGDLTPNNGGRVVFAMEYFTDADDGANDTQFGLFADDTNDDTQKSGWFSSPRIMSSQFRDYWEKIYPMFSELETATDLVEIKYRTSEQDPVYFSGTWTGTDRANTTTELSAFSGGDEVTIVQGKGAGAIGHVAVTGGAGSEIVFDRDITGVTVGQTSKFKIEKWTKAASISDIAQQGYSLGEKNTNHWIEVKAYLRWTGKREFYGMLIINKSSIS